MRRSSKLELLYPEAKSSSSFFLKKSHLANSQIGHIHSIFCSKLEFQ
jgi:hypothetical protein